MKQILRFTGLLLTSLALVATAAAQGSDASRKVSQYTCKDIMRMDGDDRDIAIAFLHGYLLGSKKADDFHTTTLAAATDRFIETCLDNPKRQALEVMQQATK
jgi:hypothetical protein